MVRIDYTAQDNVYKLELEGHATVPIVCSAVSCLFYTLGEKVGCMCDDGLVDNFIRNDDDDYKIISASPIGSYNILFEVFDTILCGLCMLAEEYPNDIDLHA